MRHHAFLPMAVVLGLGLLLGFLVAGSLSLPASLAAPATTTLYVQSGGTEDEDCSSWTNACKLQ